MMGLSAGSRNSRILVVDDNEAIHQDFDKILKTEAGGSVLAGNVNGYDVAARDDAERKRAQELRPAVLKALQDNTGETFAASADWHAWWTKNRATRAK